MSHDSRVHIVLFQTVGTGGNSSSNQGTNPNKSTSGNVWEGMYYLAQHVKPDVLVHLCSRKTHDETLPKFYTCETTQEPVTWEKFTKVSEEINDIEKLRTHYIGVIDEYRKKYPDSVFKVDFTSGTKAMSAALTLAAIEQGVTELLYATGTRGSDGRVEDTNQVITISTGDIRADRRLRMLGELFDLGQFAAVEKETQDLLKELSDEQLKLRCRSLLAMARVYAKWDLFDWKEAHNLIKQAHNECKNSGWDLNKIADQDKFLAACQPQIKSKPARPEQLVDLFASAKRCIELHRFDDAVARLYRLAEWIGQARLDKYELSSSGSVNCKKLVEKISKEACLKLNLNIYDSSCKIRGQVKLGLKEIYEVLGLLNDPVSEKYKEINNSAENGDSQSDNDEDKSPKNLAKALTQRNNSFLAHGVKPVGPLAAGGLAGYVEQLLKAHFEDSQPLNDYVTLQEQATYMKHPR